MNIHQLTNNKNLKDNFNILLFKIVILIGISSLVFSEYLRRIQQNLKPRKLLLLPTTKSVEEFLDIKGQFISWLSNNLINEMMKKKIFIKYSNNPEFVIFNKENIELTKDLIDSNILPNISKNISELIRTKFNLNNPNQQEFYESIKIDLFERKNITSEQFDFVVEEIVLQFLLFAPSIKKDIVIPLDNRNIIMNKNSIITINNEKALCNILFNDNIINNRSVIELLEFVTSTSFESEGDHYLINTYTDNIVKVIDII
jgi:hypothetical protein